jgi:hypothetical protein
MFWRHRPDRHSILLSFDWEGYVMCNQYPRGRMINGYGEEIEEVVSSQPAGLIGSSATAHYRIRVRGDHCQ